MGAVRIIVGGALGGSSASTGFLIWGIKGAVIVFAFTMVAWSAGLLWAVE